MQKKFTPDATRRFLDALTETRHVEKAARAVGVSKDTVYRHRRNNAEFRRDWERALERSDIVLRDEAMRRIEEGIEQPVFYHGKQVATVRKFNDSLLINLLKLEIRRHERQERLAAEAAANKKDGLDEILELIDGKTRGIHDEL